MDLTQTNEKQVESFQRLSEEAYVILDPNPRPADLISSLLQKGTDDVNEDMIGDQLGPGAFWQGKVLGINLYQPITWPTESLWFACF